MQDRTISGRIPANDYFGVTELIDAGRYINESGVIRQAIKCLLGKENIAPCRYCGKMRILNVDGLCQQCAQAKETGT